MSLILNSQRFTLKQVAAKLNVHLATVWRWTLTGVRGQKLPTVFVGGRRYVLKESLEAFLAAGEAQPSQLPAAEARATAASKILDTHGFAENRTGSGTTRP
jgi:hypothetical protein